ncbi:hypothetical protein MOQ_002835 [Trypanosoma cruzi marinkellei]|uniref:Uncharacterized protein n=1 Tax=Trypanosoma cruzi marinkellei TaxID=85056 RepID=K2MDL1_TRYCR|nr:hypothetical protein MOQ_002835 [Trypanosoma cruzi marinkellei]
MVRTTFKKVYSLAEVRKAVKLLQDVATCESSLASALQSSPKAYGLREGSAVEGGTKLLCVWDVDDTLVASGALGVRQYPIFPEDELVSLFRGCRARHLLLSQGSVDDVFAPDGAGKLEFLAPFFLSAGDPPRGGSSKAHTGCSNVFVCSKPPNVKSANGKYQENTRDVTVVRIATSRGAREQPDDSRLFLSEQTEPPRCPSDVRWLVMRPSLWGISLASLSNFIAPSANTAFLDGSVFCKMDIVRSLAASGNWDAVFFIDNDLSEVGVVRPGLHIEDYYRMKRLGKLSRFFQSDTLLLQASAKLAEREYGMDFSKTNGILLATTASLNSLSSKKLAKKANKNGSVNSDSLKYQLSTIVDMGGSASTTLTKCQQPFTRVVDLFVAHFHMDGQRYRRITKTKQNAIEYREKDQWHSVFRTGPACNDDDYAEVMSSFALYEAEVRSYGLTNDSELTPVPGWEPSVNVVTYPMYDRPPFPRCLPYQYQNICHQITTNLIDQWDPHLTEQQQYDLKKEANNLFRRLIRRQPVIDPMLIVRTANTLFSILTAERRLPRSFGETLKKDVQALMNGNGL